MSLRAEAPAIHGCLLHLGGPWCLTLACGSVGMASMEAPGRHQSGTLSMAQGQLGLYWPCPAEIQPAAQRVKARVYLGPDAPRPAEHLRGRLGERGGAGPWCLTVACGYVGMASMEVPGRHQSGTLSMAQGQLGLYGPCPAEIQPAAQRVKAESMTWGRTRRGPRSINADDSGSEEERAAGGPGPGSRRSGRARSAH